MIEIRLMAPAAGVAEAVLRTGAPLIVIEGCGCTTPPLEKDINE